MAPYDICLANFTFGDVAGMKPRPVLLLTSPIGPVPEILVAYISSIVPAANELLPTDIVLDPSLSDQAGVRLKVKSVVRLHKLATLHQRSVVRRIGSVPAPVAREAAEKLRVMLRL